MIKVTDESYENFIKSGNKTKILKLGATWCTPCNLATPPCNELAKELEKGVEIGELDIEESANTPVMLSCKGVPLFVKFKEGKVSFDGSELSLEPPVVVAHVHVGLLRLRLPNQQPF